MAIERISVYNANRLLDIEVEDGVWLSIHDADPGEDGDNELAVDRVFVDNWSPAASKALHNVDDVFFPDLPECSIAYLGIWDAAEGGNFLRSTPRMAGSPLVVTPLAVTAGTTVKLPAESVVVKFSNVEI